MFKNPYYKPNISFNKLYKYVYDVKKNAESEKSPGELLQECMLCLF